MRGIYRVLFFLMLAVAWMVADLPQANAGGFNPFVARRAASRQFGRNSVNGFGHGGVGVSVFGFNNGFGVRSVGPFFTPRFVQPQFIGFDAFGRPVFR